MDSIAYYIGWKMKENFEKLIQSRTVYLKLLIDNYKFIWPYCILVWKIIVFFILFWCFGKAKEKNELQCSGTGVQIPNIAITDNIINIIEFSPTTVASASILAVSFSLLLKLTLRTFTNNAIAAASSSGLKWIYRRLKFSVINFNPDDLF